MQPKGKEKHFCRPWKNKNILAAHFEAWKSFCSHFEVWKIILQSNWEFRSPFLKLGAFSHFKKIFAPWKGFFALWISRCEIPAQLCVVCLLMAITSSFQIQIMYRLKHWIPDFPSFKIIYGMHNLSSMKCFKNVSNSSEIWCGCNISISALHSRLQTVITSAFQIQITHRLKLWIPDFPNFEMVYSM